MTRAHFTTTTTTLQRKGASRLKCAFELKNARIDDYKNEKIENSIGAGLNNPISAQRYIQQLTKAK